MSATVTDTTGQAPPNWRIAPSLPVAIGVFIAYVVVFIGLTSTSGLKYQEYFATGPNVMRAAVIPLACASVLLVLFLLWARWDFVFKDPDRLPMSPVLWVPIVLYAVAIVAQFAVVDWGNAMDRLLPIIAAGVLVGFAEETLFRGIILRSLRTNGRPEAWVMLFASLWFGFFHLTNLANGSPPAGVLVQCVLASAGGVMYYVFRRARGLLVLAMVAHGAWDMSLFLPAPTGALANVGNATLVVTFIAAVIAAIFIVVRDRTLVVSRSGVQVSPQAAPR